MKYTQKHKEILNERDVVCFFFFLNFLRDVTEYPFVEEICTYFCID